MATTAESAKKWLEENKPSNDQIQTFLTKLETRIQQWQGEDDAIQGSIDAALVLESALDIAQSHVIEAPAFDASGLIPEAAPTQISSSEKSRLFNELKSSIGVQLNTHD